jgi:hypothetical protein
MEKKELDSMKKHRVAFLALGLAALIGLSTSEARAGNVTLTLSWTGGTTGAIDFTSPFAQLGSTADSLTIDTTVLNAFLGGNGSNLQFSTLSADSNNPGSAVGAVLRETGNVIISGAGGDNTISIVASQDGFMSPSGSGALLQASSANFTGTILSTQDSSVALDGTTTSSPTFTGSGGFDTHAVAASGNAAGYTLTSTSNITLSGLVTNSSDQFSNKAVFTAAAIPEPASIIMMLTGMPLPLVVLGLLRRRRAAA